MSKVRGYRLVGKRAATNVVATMLIFGIMIASVGVLYSQIAPTLLGYETTATTTNQTFIFQTVANEATNLASSSEGTVSRVHILSEDTQYDINTGNDMAVDVTRGGSTIHSDTIDIRSFVSRVNGSFQGGTGESFENRISQENTFINNNTGDPNYVLKSDYTYSEGVFTMYFRGRINVHQVAAGEWQIDITLIQIDFLANNVDNSPTSFPVKLDEWTLRLNRRGTQVNSVTDSSAGTISVSHSLAGQTGESYSFSNIPSGDTVTVNIITIPIIFGL